MPPANKELNREDLDKMLSAAMEYHQNGNLERAKTIYDLILEIEPDNPDASHLMGVLYYQLGKNILAEDLIKKAIIHNEDDPFYHFNLGLVLDAQGKVDESISAYNKALFLKPDLPEIHNNLGNAYASKGEFNKAVTFYKDALVLNPDVAEVHFNIAKAYHDLGRHDEAIECFNKAIILNPNYPEAHFNLGNVFLFRGMHDKAISSYSRAIKIKPYYAEPYNNLGFIFLFRKQFNNAIKCFKKAIELNPGYFDAFSNLAKAYRDQGEIDKALKYYDKAIKQNPDSAKIHFNKAVTLLLSCNFEQGWKEYEWRLKDPEITIKRDYQKPKWDGTPLLGKRILIDAEQGIGDTIQFARYLSHVKTSGGNVIFRCRPELKSLFKNNPCIELLVDNVEDNVSEIDFDVYSPLLSLAGIFKTGPDNYFPEIPYIKIDTALINEWKKNLDCSKINVGLVWAGNPGHLNDHNRSIDPNQLSRLRNIKNMCFYSLQKGKRDDQSFDLPKDLNMTDMGDRLKDFADTAALIHCLDLVISVDTAVAHLAGALGKPVWTLLPFAPDWRWQLNRNDSPWYPTMNLFRQPQHDDWESVISILIEKLSCWIKPI